jgi:LacI family transcriptional regulator
MAERKRIPVGSGARAASITAVARQAGVSLGTVSRVMNGAESVDAELRRRVMIAARQLGFVQRSTRANLALIAGRHSPTLPVGYTAIMTSLLERMAAEVGFGVEVFEEERFEDVAQSHIVAAVGVVFTDRIVDLVEVPRLPVITINHPLVKRGIHSVYTDHFEQGLIAARHLLERGHRSIAFLADLRHEWGARERLRGYQAAMKAAKAAVKPEWVWFTGGEPPHDTVCRWAAQKVTGILNFSEDTAPQVLHVLQNVLGLKIGKDISTVTLEDIPFYQYFSPPQTVIRQPLEELARTAVALAAELVAECRMANWRASDVRDVCLHGELVARESVAECVHGSRGGKAIRARRTQGTQREVLGGV